MKFLILIIIFSQSSFACFTPPRPWTWNEQELVFCTQNIVIGEFDGQYFRVKEKIKGNFGKGSKIKNALFNSDRSKDLVWIEPDCSSATNFKKGETYIVLQNGMNDKAYKNIKDSDSKAWIDKIKQFMSNKDFKSDCKLSY